MACRTHEFKEVARSGHVAIAACTECGTIAVEFHGMRIQYATSLEARVMELERRIATLTQKDES